MFLLFRNAESGTNIKNKDDKDSFVFFHQDSLDYFGERRTDKSRSSKFQGVETPSQVRTSQKL